MQPASSTPCFVKHQTAPSLTSSSTPNLPREVLASLRPRVPAYHHLLLPSLHPPLNERFLCGLPSDLLVSIYGDSGLLHRPVLGRCVCERPAREDSNQPFFSDLTGCGQTGSVNRLGRRRHSPLPTGTIVIQLMLSGAQSALRPQGVCFFRLFSSSVVV